MEDDRQRALVIRDEVNADEKAYWDGRDGYVIIKQVNVHRELIHEHFYGGIPPLPILDSRTQVEIEVECKGAKGAKFLEALNEWILKMSGL